MDTTKALEVMQALTAIHSAIEKLNQTELEQLNSLEMAAIQSYYVLVKQKLLEQEQNFSSLTPRDAASVSQEPTKKRQSRKTSSSSRQKSKSKEAASVDAYLQFYEDLKDGFQDID